MNKTARLRVENILIESVDEGKAYKNGYLVAERGWLGTSAKGFIKYFELKDELRNVILKKLEQKLQNSAKNGISFGWDKR